MTEPIPELDVLIPTHNRLDLTMRCINALYSNTAVPFHTIVLDDSTDGLTPLYFKELCTNGVNPLKQITNLTFIRSEVPFKSGNQFFNIGFRYMKSPYAATVMNSIRVEPEWEIGALNTMKENPDVGIIGFKCLLPDGTIESAGIRMMKYLPADLGRGLPGHRISGIYVPDAVQWAFCLLRKSAVVGNLTEDVFHGFKGWDDIDNCLVVKSRGWRILYCGQGVGYHEPRATRGSNDEEAARLNKENGEIFYKRWGFWETFLAEHPGYLEGKETIHASPLGMNITQ